MNSTTAIWICFINSYKGLLAVLCSFGYSESKSKSCNTTPYDSYPHINMAGIYYKEIVKILVIKWYNAYDKQINRYFKTNINVIFASMNKITDRNQNNPMIPLTPNLEQWKLHGKTKPKKKNLCPAIQPTLQPNLVSQKYPTTPTTTKLGACYNHPDKNARFINKDNRKQLCGLCAVTDGGGDAKFVDEQKNQKKGTIQIFKKRVNVLKDSIASKELQVRNAMNSQEDRYGEYFAYLSNSFKNLIEDIEQKHRQLNSALIQSIHRRKQAVSQTFQLMTEIKQSIDRYIYDINRNYEQILAQLPLQNFREIMNQYNTKVQYYSENVKKISKDDNINVYLPIQEIRRVIDKANIQYFVIQSDRMGSTRSLEKFISCGSGKDQTSKYERQEKEQKYDRIDRNDKNDRKSESKVQQRKRNNTNNMVHLIRGANKQNNYLDSYYNYEAGEQRSYNE